MSNNEINKYNDLYSALIDEFAKSPLVDTSGAIRTQSQFLTGVSTMLLLLVGTAMVSRIAKAFQDYIVNVIIQKFGAALFTDGLKHSMRLPYQEFEDQAHGFVNLTLVSGKAKKYTIQIKMEQFVHLDGCDRHSCFCIM